MKKRWIPNRFQKILIKQENINNNKRKLFYSSFVKKGDLCFDVGANMGNSVKPLLEMGAKVIAIEPQENCYKFLDYRFGNQIEIVKKGLGEKEEIRNLYVSIYDVISSFSQEWISSVKKSRFKIHTWDKVVRVEMTTLDKLIEKYGNPNFIKIDVEGFELEVLKGLNHSIDMISFEYTIPEQTATAIGCIQQIENNDCKIKCNYSIGESMEFALHDWIPADEMKKHVISDEFRLTGFGDIYVKI